MAVSISPINIHWQLHLSQVSLLSILISDYFFKFQVWLIQFLNCGRSCLVCVCVCVMQWTAHSSPTFLPWKCVFSIGTFILIFDERLWESDFLSIFMLKKMRFNEFRKTIYIIWNCRLPSTLTLIHFRPFQCHSVSILLLFLLNNSLTCVHNQHCVIHPQKWWQCVAKFGYGALLTHLRKKEKHWPIDLVGQLFLCFGKGSRWPKNVQAGQINEEIIDWLVD